MLFRSIGKFTIFNAAYESANIAVVVVGVLSSAVAAFFYIRVIVMMFFADPTDDSVAVTIPAISTRITIFLSALITLILGVFPAPILDAIASLATFVR